MRKFGLFAVLPIIGLVSGCATQLQSINDGLGKVNDSMISARTMAAPETGPQAQASVEVPNDKRISSAFDEALPSVKRVVGIHKCINHPDGMSLLNREAVPGVIMLSSYRFPNTKQYMKYHNHGRCVGVRAIDKITMPANNALQMRVVYFAEDSGESVNFELTFRKTGSGAWMLSEDPRLLTF